MSKYRYRIGDQQGNMRTFCKQMSKVPRGGCAISGERSGYTAALSGRPAGAKVDVIWGLQNGHLLIYSDPAILGGLLINLATFFLKAKLTLKTHAFKAK